MNLTNLGLGSVLNLMNACIDHALIGMAIYGAVGLLAAWILVRMAKRSGLFWRKKPSLRFLKSLYPIYFFVVLGLGGVAFGGIHFAKTELVERIPRDVTPLNQISFTGYQYVIIKNWDAIHAQNVPFDYTVDKHLSEIHFEPMTADWTEAQMINAANDFGPTMSRWGLEGIIRCAMDEQGINPDDASSEEERSAMWLAATRDADIINYPDAFWTRVDSYTVEQLKAHWVGFYFKVIGGILLLLLLPIIETIFNYKRSYRPDVG